MDDLGQKKRKVECNTDCVNVAPGWSPAGHFQELVSVK